MLSVVLCTYNGAPYLPEQLDSILAQTLRPDEIVVQDDGSTDGTLSILERYAATHPCIRLFRNEGEHGVNANFFSAMAKAQGDFIAISDQDDIWLPHKLERQMQAIGSSLLTAGLSHPFSTTGTEFHVDLRRPNYSLLRLLYIGAFSGHTMLFSRELLRLLPAETKEVMPLRYYDAILAMVAAAHESIAFLHEELVRHRRHTGAASYTRPTGTGVTLPNIVRSVARTFRQYQQLRPEMRRRLAAHLRFLNALEGNSPTLDAARHMLELQTQHGPIAFIRLQAFCAAHCTELFHTPVPPTLFNKLRALYFPVSCSDYFRYLCK